MTEQRSRLRIEIAPTTIFLVLGVFVGLWMLERLTTVLAIVTIALVLVGTLDPIVAWLEHRGLKRGRALVLIFSAVALGFTALVLLMVPPLVAQLLDLLANAPHWRERVVRALDGYSWSKAAIAALREIPIDNIDARAGAALLDYSTQLLVLIGYGISTIFLAIYILAEPQRSKGLIYAVVPRHHHVMLAKILIELRKIVGGYMRGQLITSLAMGVFVFVVLTACGADNTLAIALFAGLTDVIPFVGGYIASLPVILAVTPAGTTATLIVIVLVVLYQEFESRVLVPRIYGTTLRLPPAVVVVSLLVGGTLGGILGALLALPIAAGLQMLVRELRFELPGEAPAAESVHEIDERASATYERLAEGVPASTASAIAEELAMKAKKTEQAVEPAPLPNGAVGGTSRGRA